MGNVMGGWALADSIFGGGIGGKRKRKNFHFVLLNELVEAAPKAV